MPPTRHSLKSFLQAARNALRAPPSQRPKPLTFVIGNESADLDSLCSAVLFAYFRTHTAPHTLHIPLSHLPRADLALRPELTAALVPAGLKPDDLLTLTDLPPVADRSEGKQGVEDPDDGLSPLHPQDTQWLLVDHNALTGQLASRFADRVVGCIDHHDDEGVVPAQRDLPPGNPRVIAKCGSCMSLVVDRYRSLWDDLSSLPCHDETATTCDSQLAHLALAPMLIDTATLMSQDKTTETDIRSVEFAEAKISPLKTTPNTTNNNDTNPPSSYNRENYHSLLSHHKQSITSLTYHDLLRKDYKRWTEGRLTLGISSIVRNLTYLFTHIDTQNRTAFLHVLRRWAHEQELDVVAVMTASNITEEGEGDGERGFRRELLVWGVSEEGGMVVRRFGESFGGVLGLVRWGVGELDCDGGDEDGGLRVGWWQREVKHSRKQVGPMLREVMRDGARL
ncbi:uncharacterized protein C8A04DRAFT_26157 [Dichotomopilus funicola]|uniref:DHHA2 domain-containing protein n=1 Tax=Dichotomopilus funicola TaxID=1934379 RepID=A0AAN6V709_9PEZI|nr:hypothetical protein C8A04DRAFT_26157 [Dichotomopilus funicola]